MAEYFSLPGMIADANLKTKKYHAVKAGATARQVSAITNANAEKPLGLLQNDPDALGQPATVAVYGVCYWEAGATVSYGDSLACNNDGEAITDAENTSGGTVDLHHMAYALEAGVDGDIIRVLLHTPLLVGTE